MVRLQLMLYCFTKDIKLSEGDYNFLVYVAIHGYSKSNTPHELVRKGAFIHPQSVRNTRKRMILAGLLVDKVFTLNPELQIESSGIIMVDFKAINS